MGTTDRPAVRVGDLATLDTFAGPLAVRVTGVECEGIVTRPQYGLMRAGDRVTIKVTATGNRSYARGETIDANPLRMRLRRAAVRA